MAGAPLGLEYAERSACLSARTLLHWQSFVCSPNCCDDHDGIVCWMDPSTCSEFFIFINKEVKLLVAAYVDVLSQNHIRGSSLVLTNTTYKL